MPGLNRRRLTDLEEHVDHPCRPKDNRTTTGIQFVTDEKDRRVAVQIDLKKHGALWEDFRDGLMSESRRSEKSIPYEKYRANRLDLELIRQRCPQRARPGNPGCDTLRS
jgi:hypothetical protein